jgi:hypothetical protein
MSGNISALRTHQFRVWSCANRPLLACQVVRSQISCLGEFSIAPRIGGMARLVHDCGSGSSSRNPRGVSFCLRGVGLLGCRRDVGAADRNSTTTSPPWPPPRPLSPHRRPHQRPTKDPTPPSAPRCPDPRADPRPDPPKPTCCMHQASTALPFSRRQPPAPLR